MLDDTPRKILRVIVHFNAHFKRMPRLDELSRLSGRQPADILKGVGVLAAEHYVAWETGKPVEAAVILEGWERNVPFDSGGPQKSEQGGRHGGNVDYWLFY